MTHFLGLAAYFFTASVCGWVIDTVLRSVRRKRWAPIRRLPFSPAYGLCSFAIYFAPDAVRHGEPWVQFAYFAATLSAAEFGLGAFILAVTGKRIWDYRDRHLNLLGHADAFHTLIWGVVGTAVLRYVSPPFEVWFGVADGTPPGWWQTFGLPVVLAGTLGLTGGVMIARRRFKWAAVLAALYVPQALVLAWMGASLFETTGALAPWLVAFLGAGFTLVMAHRLTTYVFPLPPAPWHVWYVAPMHVFQTAMFVWVVVWPASRLAPAGAATDLIALLAPLILAGLALLTTHRPPRLVEVRIGETGLSGLRVAQISDLHVGPYTSPARLDALARRVNALDVDLLALTGDLLTLRHDDDRAALLAFVDALEAPPLGIFACSGNHDMAVWDALRAELEARGVHVLDDAAHPIEGPGGTVQVVGLAWRGARARRAGAYADALRGAAVTGVPALVLCHDPQAFDDLGADWRGVQLAGHYHGGQIGLTSLGIDVSVLRPFGVRDQGVFGEAPRWLYSHRGTGTYGFPVRVGVPSEIARLVLD